MPERECQEKKAENPLAAGIPADWAKLQVETVWNEQGPVTGCWTPPKLSTRSNQG
jgi:hypothetical protein